MDKEYLFESKIWKIRAYYIYIYIIYENRSQDLLSISMQSSKEMYKQNGLPFLVVAGE